MRWCRFCYGKCFNLKNQKGKRNWFHWFRRGWCNYSASTRSWTIFTSVFFFLLSDMLKSTSSLRKSRSIGTAVIRYFSEKTDSPTNGGSNAGGTSENSEVCEENLLIKINIPNNISYIMRFQIPPPPTNCCMSGCANCVWIEYAEMLTDKLRGSTDLAREIIMKEVQDTNMRAFLEMEIRNLAQNKKPK